MTRIGFTGTQNGMTDIQAQMVFDELMMFSNLTEAHHGCSIGADAQFDDMLAYVPKTCIVHGHPPRITTKMAKDCRCEVWHEPQDYLVRNRAIVDAVQTMIAAPQGEEELRSGTWSTVRYARKQGITVQIIMPSGHSRLFRGKVWDGQ